MRQLSCSRSGTQESFIVESPCTEFIARCGSEWLRDHSVTRYGIYTTGHNIYLCLPFQLPGFNSQRMHLQNLRFQTVLGMPAPVNILFKRRQSHRIIKTISVAYQCAEKETPPIEWYMSNDLNQNNLHLTHTDSVPCLRVICQVSRLEPTTFG